MSDVAGSGGYYIAMGAKKIFAAPCTLTGSIGVIGGKLVTRGLYDKLGLNTEVIARGAIAARMSSDQPFSPDERKVWIEAAARHLPPVRQQGCRGPQDDVRRAGGVGARPGLYGHDRQEARPG